MQERSGRSAGGACWAEQPGTTSEASAPRQPYSAGDAIASLGERDEATLYAAGVTEEILAKLPRFKD
jgi:TolB-like protein